MIDLRPFQREFISQAVRPEIDTACLSTPRGNGKSALGGHLVTRILDPDDDLFRPGTESVLCAASIEQARIVFRFARADLEPTGRYRFLDSHTRIGITHKETNTRLRVIGSNGKTAMGLVGCPWAICDEPGSWLTNGGTLLHDAIQTAQGKPSSPLKALYIGTLAPATGGWWHDLIAGGSHGSVYVQALQGNPDKWSQWSEIRRCNPLAEISADFRKKLLAERDEARRDTRLKARFLSYRLNIPTGDESDMLLTVDDWKRALDRPVGIPAGRPVVGIDLGYNRAWSAAVAIFDSGVIDAIAVAPGIPAIAQLEKRDRVPGGSYQRLVDNGSLRIAEGLRVQPPAQLIEAIREEWGTPANNEITCDFFRLADLQDCIGRIRVITRRTRWSEAGEDIRALRKMMKDGPLSVTKNARGLLSASLSAAMVKPDDSGNVRMVKRGTNNQARDDVAAALVLAAGQFHRNQGRPRRSWRYAGAA